MDKHQPVLVAEVIEYLKIDSNSRIVDATLSRGGHTRAILEKYPDAKILGIEFDPDIFSKFREEPISDHVKAVNDSYVHIKEICAKEEFQPTAILFDLGVSSHHYGNGRGFSFKADEPLDMRFNPEVQMGTSADIINSYTAEELEKILTEYGEEIHSSQIVEEIMKSRRVKLITSTGELTEIIMKAVPEWYKRRKIHPATKTFQALRIAVNDELSAIEAGLRGAIEVLVPGGRIAVLAFHGLEDKLVRKIFKEKTADASIKWVTKDTIKPKWEEIKMNKRARSAKMKIIEKI